MTRGFIVLQRLKSRLTRMSQLYNDLLVQQFTAATIVTYLLFVVGSLAMNSAINYYSWRYFLTGYSMASFSTLFILSLCWQCWFSLQNIIQIYFVPSYVRSGLLFFAFALNLFYFAWGLSILWDIYI